MHQEEDAASGVDVLAHLLASAVEGRDGRTDGEPAVSADLGGDPADASDVGFAVLFGEGEPGAEVAAHDVAIKAGHGARAVLKQEVMQGASDRGLSATGEAGEEHHEAALV